MDNVVLIEAPGVALMLQPRLLGTWFVFAQDPAISSAEATLRLVRQHVEQNPGGSAYLVFKTLDADRHLLVRREGDDLDDRHPQLRAPDDVAETEGLDDSALLRRHRGVPWPGVVRDVAPGTGLHARPDRGRGPDPPPGRERRVGCLHAAEEYGVRKDDGHGLVKPVNSSGGLLFLAVLASLFAGGVAYGLVRIAVDGTWEILGDVWWTIPVGILVPLVAWTSYAKERKAEKLRKARNLPRPVD